MTTTMENKEMTTTIYSHKIEYSWADGESRELVETDVEHIEFMLKEDYISGELCQHDSEKGYEHKGWWKISK